MGERGRQREGEDLLIKLCLEVRCNGGDTMHMFHWFKILNSLVQMVKNLPAMWETWFYPWVGKIPWRRKWQPTPVSLPGKSHGQRSLVGCRPWGHKESGMTERLLLIHTGMKWSEETRLPIWSLEPREIPMCANYICSQLVMKPSCATLNIQRKK